MRYRATTGCGAFGACQSLYSAAVDGDPSTEISLPSYFGGYVPFSVRFVAAFMPSACKTCTWLMREYHWACMHAHAGWLRWWSQLRGRVSPPHAGACTPVRIPTSMLARNGDQCVAVGRRSTLAKQ